MVPDCTAHTDTSTIKIFSPETSRKTASMKHLSYAPALLANAQLAAHSGPLHNSTVTMCILNRPMSLLEPRKLKQCPVHICTKLLSFK